MCLLAERNPAMVLFRTLFRGRRKRLKSASLRSPIASPVVPYRVYPPQLDTRMLVTPARPSRPITALGGNVSQQSARRRLDVSSVPYATVVKPRRSVLTRTAIKSTAATAALARIGDRSARIEPTVWQTWATPDDYAVIDYVDSRVIASSAPQRAPQAAMAAKPLDSSVADEIPLYQRRCVPRPDDAKRVRDFQSGYRSPHKKWVPWC